MVIRPSDYRRPVDSDLFYSTGAWRHATPIDDLKHWSRDAPNKTAIVTKYADARPDQRVSFATLHSRVAATATNLVRLGVHKSDVVSFQLPNWWQFTVLYLACNQVGAIANPILPFMREHELEFILNDVNSRLLFVPGLYRGYDYVEMAAHLRKRVNSLEYCFQVGARAAGALPSFEDEFLHDSGHPNLRRVDPPTPTGPDDIAVIKYTSGTTGQPKGVLHTHNTLYATCRAVPEMMHVGHDDVIFMASPLVHMSGFLYGMLMPIMCGMTAVYQDIWDAKGMVQAIEDEKCTWTMGATPYVIDLLAELSRSGRAVTSFRSFACSGAPIPRDLGAKCEEHGFALFPVWGMTETGSVTFVGPGTPEQYRHVSDGRPSPWMRIKVVGAGGVELPPGVTGALRVRGASVCLGYLNRPDLTEASIDSDGWLDTGDLARLLPDHKHIQLEGREKDIIIRGGENVPVVEIEGILRRHKRVRDVAIIGYADERLGERALAVVVPHGAAPSLEDLLECLRLEKVAKYYWPERLAIVESLPYTASGKVRKAELRARLTPRLTGT